MLGEALVSYFHFLGIMVLFAALTAQHLFFTPLAKPWQVKRLFIVDGLFGAAATLVLLTGLAKVFWVGKPAVFYAQNGFFHAKITLFILIALLSIYPTVQFFKAHRASKNLGADDHIALPAAIRTIQRIELMAVLSLPLFAVLMARAA